ncbi:MAG TPA: glycosyltransferase [Terriglobales bacterium]|nr:glycosyltransferase [Terriglobales bacterium]
MAAINVRIFANDLELQLGTIRLFVNGLAATAGGGMTYIRNIASQLAAREDVHTTFLVPRRLAEEIPHTAQVSILTPAQHGGILERSLYEQWRLPELLDKNHANVLLSAGNFALYKSPIPQILLSRNALYTCKDYYRDLHRRGELRLWLDTKTKGLLAKRSVNTAEVTVAPSRAFAEELCAWTGQSVTPIHHGFDLKSFQAHNDELESSIEKQLATDANIIRLLFVSHYNYYRNFETLIRGFGKAVSRSKVPLQLLLTCKLVPGANPGPYNPRSAARLVEQLGLRPRVLELGNIPYFQLHQLHRRCHIYVTAAYCESFAHPLVEAMSSGLPVIASDIPVHREICESAAIYFPHFSDEMLCERIIQLAASVEKRQCLSSLGSARSREFSWSRHVEKIISIAKSLVSAKYD